MTKAKTNDGDFAAAAADAADTDAADNAAAGNAAAAADTAAGPVEVELLS
eukprot:CAMPEP_0203656430 /NCGR_PEP_ID=MMETSP0088-20131115/41568_1 /ASSEMBLY_ACC=CAM_ASM_001087 /TAXON_ID=426623 /ORGANISM="Chaetoceros affinis, Strain CCMP159" /LENGTH=49 /DNA_ID=CAMNT_0050517413 /DNA_START=199 /DNA_END=348 /DNA_ORIENTATION=-